MLKAADEKRRKKQENAGERGCGKKDGRDTNRLDGGKGDVEKRVEERD